MKAKLRAAGYDGSRAYNDGDEYDGDGEWIRRQLINGLANPLDDAARKICDSDHQRERYRSQALTEAAKELRPAAEIPALAGGDGKTKKR